MDRTASSSAPTGSRAQPFVGRRAPALARPPVCDVLVVDDHAPVRAALVSLLADAEDLNVVADVGDGARAVALAHEHQPDVVVVALSTSVRGGRHPTSELLAVAPGARVLILTAGIGHHRALDEALAAGAVGYVLKEAKPHECLGVIRTVAHQPRGRRLDQRALLTTRTRDAYRVAHIRSDSPGEVPDAGHGPWSAFNVRASDADRDSCAKALQQHFLAGRLDLDELCERVESAYAARTLAQLDVLFYDLPPRMMPRRRR